MKAQLVSLQIALGKKNGLEVVAPMNITTTTSSATAFCSASLEEEK
jgi:hypothetical protein